MNNYELVLGWTLAAEGVFSDHAWDPGGKTLYGIAQTRWPAWYAKIAAARGEASRLAVAKDFYWKEFWSKLRCDFIDSVYVAGELFDTGVNMGIGTGGSLTQLAVNVVAAQEGGGNVTVDGRMGPMTVAAINRISRRYELQLVHWQNWWQGKRYIDLWERDPARWNNAIAGWASRLVVHPKFVGGKRPEFG